LKRTQPLPLAVLTYFPFQDHFNERPGTLPLKPADALIEVDAHYEAEIALKQQLLTNVPGYYFQATPGSELAQWDVLDAVLTDLAVRQPHQFSLRVEECTGRRAVWHWQNHRLGTSAAFTFGNAGTLPHAPLDWVGRQVQEDLLILDGPEAVLVAGQLCFGNVWSLDEKMGLPFKAIHAPINPIVPPMMQAAQTIMARLPVGKPLWRLNWSLKTSSQLDMTTRRVPELRAEMDALLPHLTAANAGEHVWVRIERQTLTRLPTHSGAILFTVRTYQNRLVDECRVRTDGAARLLAVLETTPPAMLDYKGITPFVAPTLAWLRQQVAVL
jgi:dimethylamine monooxygenase subunit A